MKITSQTSTFMNLLAETPTDIKCYCNQSMS
uniref:Uncharacterized protein n=1 Tax=Anguilla anguilla TaxID=7936 RepID=A0A0E9PPJ1_ANGAN